MLTVGGDVHDPVLADGPTRNRGRGDIIFIILRRIRGDAGFGVPVLEQ